MCTFNSKSKGNKSKNKPIGLHKLKNFCTAHHQYKKSNLNGRKYSQMTTSNKRLISKLYSNHTTQQCKTNSIIKKWTETKNRSFIKDIKMANRHLKRCSSTLTTGECTWKPQWDKPYSCENRYYQKDKKQVLMRKWRKGTIIHFGGNEYWQTIMENNMETTQNIKNKNSRWPS